MNASRKLFVLFLAWTAALVLAPQAQVVVTGSIGDTVFIDYNANDLPDAGEGAPGVTMTLYDETGVTVLDTTATDASGQYLFAGLATGTYVVAVATNTLPAPAGQWINTYDPDGGTPDRSTVTLPHSPSNGPLAVLLGTAETYAVLAGSTVTSTGDTTVDGDLGVSPGSAVTGFPPGILSNGVFHVADAPAIQAQVDLVAAYNDVAGRGVDATLAAGLGGTTLTPGVYDSADTTFGITGTLTLDAQGDANAVFIFQAGSTLITAGNSQVVLINGAQAGNVFWQVGSSATLGTDSTFAGSILALTSITLTTGANVEGRVLARNGAVTMDSNHVGLPRLAGENDLDQDFGYQADNPNTIGGTLWDDLNANGLLEAGEIVRFAGVTVDLQVANGTVILTTATDAGGNYSFANLPDATYIVDVTDTGSVLAGYGHTLGPSPNSDNNSQSDPYTVAVGGGESNTTGDFGYSTGVATLGDFVWRDANEDGVQDAGEPGVSGVVVTLYDAASVAVDSTTTSVAGAYEFASLVPGVYHLGFAIPPGDVASPQDRGGNDARDSDVNPATGRTIPTTLVAGENDPTWDLGIYQRASLGDFVWWDTDADGVQDAGELGVSGLVVTLYDAASVAVGSTTTSVAGAYGFANLVPGVYHLGFAIPVGDVASPPDQGGNDARDSDANPATGRTIPTTLVAGENDVTWDLGVISGSPLLAVIGNVEAFTRDGQSVVRWETIESWGTAGFWLERLVGDEWVRISIDLLPFPLFDTAPIVYEETDPGVQAGGTYSWRLVELENSGNELTYGPYLLTVDGPGRTYADWAAAHFTPEELADPALSGPDADPDGDHLTNGEEFLAWTDPNQPDSVLQISSVNRTSDGLELNWDSVAGRFYRIALSDSVAGPYLPLAEPILATDGNSSAKLSVDFQDRQMYFHVILVGGE